MTSFILLDSLMKDLRNLLKEEKLACGRAVQIYDQTPPQRRTESDDESIFPYCIVRLGDGEAVSGQANQDVILFFGVYDDANNYDGYRDVVNLIETTRQHFCKYPEFGPFEVQSPMKWVYPEDDKDYPYYFGALLLRVSLPNIAQVSNFT